MPDDARGRIATAPPGTIATASLAIIAGILVVFALHAARGVILPLALALFIVALVWPVQMRMERALPRRLAYALSLALVLCLFGLFLGALGLAVTLMADRLPGYADEAAELFGRVEGWIGWFGLAADDVAAVPTDFVLVVGTTLLASTYGVAGMLTLTLIFLILGLLEVVEFRRKIERRIEARFGAAVLASLAETARRYQRYAVVRTVVSALTGALTWAFCALAGLDLAVVWGLAAFLLNFIPMLGSIIAVIPPFLFAVLQFQGATMPLLVLGGLGLIQFGIGNYLDPRLEGRTLRMSPLVVMVSIVFWGFVWGVPGALLGVPLTVGILIACEQFERTRWIAALLSDRA